MDYVFLNNMSEIDGVNPPKSQLGFNKMTKLCAAAETLFDKKGFSETSVADICGAAGAAVGTFYIYFQDKTSIYNYLIKNYYVVIKRYLSARIKNCKTRAEIECEGLRAFIEFGHEHPQCYKILWGSSFINPALFEDYYVRFAKSYESALKKYAGELVEVDYSVAAYFLMGIANFVCLKTIFAKRPLSPSELDAIINDVRKILSGGLFRK